MDRAKLAENNFDAIDKGAIEYDELRCCATCKHVCVFSAVACECDVAKVACLRHYHVLCKCATNKKFMLGK
jgi:histone demethylase JARID1